MGFLGGTGAENRGTLYFPPKDLNPEDKAAEACAGDHSMAGPFVVRLLEGMHSFAEMPRDKSE